MVTKSELMLRVLTVLVIFPIALGVIYQGGLIFNLLIFLCAVIMSLEFDKMRGDQLKTILVIAAPLYFAKTPDIAFIAALVGTTSLWFLRKAVTFVLHWALVAIVAVLLPAISIIWLREQAGGLDALVFLVAIVVATDVGAYFIGKRYGKTKLAEKISPNKTREGAIGGIICAIIVALFFEQSFVIIPIVILLSVIAIIGDLLESAIKRYFNVKDSGNILPGHGGLLDRFDGFILTLPVTALLYYSGLLSW